jgi:hypothetical protein
MAGAYEYESIGDPDTPLEKPTGAQTRRQREAERARGRLNRMHFHQNTVGERAGSIYSHTHDDDEPGHTHAGQAALSRADGGYWEESGPSLGTETPASVASNIERVWRKYIIDAPIPATDLTSWRLRLYCGHVVERPAHRTSLTVHAAFMGETKCPTCGLDPATIVAARALPST